MIDLNTLGPHVGRGNPDELFFGIMLPNITSSKGYRLFADIIHEQDQFDPAIAAIPVELYSDDNGLWGYEGQITALGSDGHMGKQGRYLYRYRLQRGDEVIVPYFSDPFATVSGAGTNSAFDYPATPAYTWHDQNFKVPNLDELVIYELMVDDFAHDFDGVKERLTYLKSLGVNCIELMPVTNIPEPYRWGYMPMSYFAIEERYGGGEKLKAFVDACHGEGISVIHDAVYAHMHEEFCYRSVYWTAGEENPMIGAFAGDMFGVGTDFNKPFTYEYFKAVNDYFINEFHMDGFRYDYVPGIYDGPLGVGYARLVYDTYQSTKGISRFNGGDHNRIIQVAEYLDKPKQVLKETYTTASKRWWPMLKAQQMVQHSGSVEEGFVHDMLLIDLTSPWPKEYNNGQDHFPVTTLQFIESHDKSRLMYLLSGEHSPTQGGFDLFNRDRTHWYRLQPYAIALMSAVGVPLLWQGQEFGEIYGKHDDGGSRVLASRPLHWNYFYEKGGRQLVNLYRKMGQLRQTYQALRSRNAYYHYEHSDLGRGLVAYQRIPDNNTDPTVMILLNFGDFDGTLTVPFPRAGIWHEKVNGNNEVLEVPGDFANVAINIPSNYGKVFISD